MRMVRREEGLDEEGDGVYSEVPQYVVLTDLRIHEGLGGYVVEHVFETIMLYPDQRRFSFGSRDSLLRRLRHKWHSARSC